MGEAPVLAGRRVIVTGAGSGLGAAYAKAAATAGAAVLVNDLDAGLADATAAAITERGGTAVAAPGNVADWAATESVVGACVDAFGGIDGLVNNAGILGQIRPVVDETEDVVRKVVDVNFLGTVFPTIHAARAMVAAGSGGAIVNVSSGNQCGHAGFSIYGASKGAVSSLTYAWARELGEHGIRVNAISPNAHTGQIDQVLAQLGHGEHAEYPAPEDNAVVVVYLLSDGSAALNGQIVRVDTGRVSVVAHPLVAAPRVPIEFSVERLGCVFQDELSGHAQPLGISIAEVNHVDFLL